MRISVVSRRNATLDPAIRALASSLLAVGHDVTLICVGKPSSDLPEDAEVRSVDDSSGSLMGKISRKFRMGDRGDRDETLVRALRETDPELVYPHRRDDVDLADRAGAPVLGHPGWPAPENDFIASAAEATDSLAEAGPGKPNPGRHEGQTVVVAYRETPTSPGRYLESAFRRSGARVVAFDGELDWDRVPAGAACVVLVESPYPPLRIIGEKKEGVPVLFWVHHGEHHLPANIRLTWRYQVDSVLLAHSLHLAHRFPVPTHFFPFAVPTELFGEPKPWSDRAYDVAMVGAGIDGSGGRYDTRRRLVAALRGDDTLRSRLTYGVAPEEMVQIYGDARLVLNDGGPRHFPITMRVFETLGAGALLLSEDIPGMSGLLGGRYAVIGNDVVGSAHALLTAGDSPARAAEAHEWAMNRHTYDHRVDALLEIAGVTPSHVPSGPPWAAATRLARVVDDDVDAQQIAVFGEVAPLGLADRAFRRGEGRGLREKSIDAVVIGDGQVDDLEGAVRAARGYVYADGGNLSRVADVLDAVRPDAPVSVDEEVLRADLGGSGYRMRPADHPLAR